MSTPTEPNSADRACVRDVLLAEPSYRELEETLSKAKDTEPLYREARAKVIAAHCSSVVAEAVESRDRRITSLEAEVAHWKDGMFKPAAAENAALREAEPQWIVNDLGELGVEVNGRCFFLYKGDNIEYTCEDNADCHPDGSPMLYRIVGKREFGETQWPQSWIEAGRRKDRYEVDLTYYPGLSDGKPEDGAWKPLPSRKQAALHPATKEGKAE